MEKVFAIYDSDTMYATRFMEYFRLKKDFNFEITAFTKKESLEDFLKHQIIEILLCGDGITPDMVPKDSIKYIYELSEHPKGNQDSDCPCIFRYQSAQKIMSELLLDYSRKENRTEYKYENEKFVIYSIFTPIPDATKMMFAWSLAHLLSETKKVLFIPLDSLPAPILIMEEGSNHGLSEFIYYLKDNNPNIILKMNSLLHNIANISYLSGLTQGLDLFSVSSEEVCRWIDELNGQMDYDAIIFYINHYSETMVELMKQSDKVFALMKELPYERVVMKEWERQMNFIGLQEHLKKVEKVFMPDEEWSGDNYSSFQELQYSAAWASAKQMVDNWRGE